MTSIREGKTHEYSFMINTLYAIYIAQNMTTIQKYAISRFNNVSYTAILISFAAQSLTCYCIGQYCTPSPSDDPTSNDDYGNSISDLVDSSASSYNNSFCEAKKGAKCFSAVTQVEDVITGEVRPDRTFGCLPPDESGFMQCKGNLVPHLNPTAIACCSDEDFCNKKLSPMYEIVDRDPNLGDNSSLGDLMPESVVTTIVLLVSIAVCVVLLIFVVTCVYLK